MQKLMCSIPCRSSQNCPSNVAHFLHPQHNLQTQHKSTTMQESSSRLLERIHACPKHTSLRERFAAAEEEFNREFRQRIHNLAPELYDKIYDYTFKIHRHTTFVDLVYRPPSILAVDRRSRKETRKTYYLNTIFTFDHTGVCMMWLIRDLDLDCWTIIRVLGDIPSFTVRLLEVEARLPGDTEMSWSNNPALDWAQF
ncbi:hypothetical protein EJ03DRAFT_358188 [Teratosphaeria nubilosa]|uniref:Uncharacterized protein n=1 Tax=Teratosphaeria nubilosa TaxID=161662 RepID=A0A6G1LGX0_9PEZI|nr:hypothetical protein EJ03DRAFT_358188 [Teratosphaeria nubilosa]